MTAEASYASIVVYFAVILLDLYAADRAGYLAEIASRADSRIDMRFEFYHRGDAVRYRFRDEF